MRSHFVWSSTCVVVGLCGATLRGASRLRRRRVNVGGGFPFGTRRGWRFFRRRSRRDDDVSFRGGGRFVRRKSLHLFRANAVAVLLAIFGLVAQRQDLIQSLCVTRVQFRVHRHEPRPVRDWDRKVVNVWCIAPCGQQSPALEVKRAVCRIRETPPHSVPSPAKRLELEHGTLGSFQAGANQTQQRVAPGPPVSVCVRRVSFLGP